MASFSWQELIDRAKVYVDDDHADEGGWIAPDKWLQFAISEYKQQYRRWVRAGYVQPVTGTKYFDDSIVDSDDNVVLILNDIYAVVGVVQDDGTQLRFLTPSQDPIWRSSGADNGMAYRFVASSGGGVTRIQLDPQPETLNLSEYYVRYIPMPEETVSGIDPTVATDTVDLPEGADERIVLGMARKAHVKDSAMSAAIREQIRDADAELAFAAAARNPGLMKVKVLPKASTLLSTPRNVWPDRSGWLYL